MVSALLAGPLAAQAPRAYAAIEKAKAALSAGRPADAVEPLEQAQSTSSDCEIPFLLGLARYRLGQDDEAVAAFQSATQCDPARVDGWMALGDAHLRKRDDNGALRAYEAALPLAPDRPLAVL